MRILIWIVCSVAECPEGSSLLLFGVAGDARLQPAASTMLISVDELAFGGKADLKGSGCGGTARHSAIWGSAMADNNLSPPHQPPSTTASTAALLHCSPG